MMTLNLIRRGIVFSKSVDSVFYSDLIVDEMFIYLSPIFIKKTACKSMHAPFTTSFKSLVDRLQMLLYAF